MKILCASLLLLSTCVFAADQPCVILKRASTGEHLWSGVEFQYVSGDYPKGFKFRENLRGRHFRELLKLGGKAQILETVYSAADLTKAQEACAASTTTAKDVK